MSSQKQPPLTEDEISILHDHVILSPKESTPQSRAAACYKLGVNASQNLHDTARARKYFVKAYSLIEDEACFESSLQDTTNIKASTANKQLSSGNILPLLQQYKNLTSKRNTSEVEKAAAYFNLGVIHLHYTGERELAITCLEKNKTLLTDIIAKAQARTFEKACDREVEGIFNQHTR